MMEKTTPAPLMAEELMIGNYLEASTTNEIIKVDWLAIKHVEDGNIQAAGYDNSPVYEPIPLTEQWLKEFGFNEIFQFPDNEYFSLNRLNSNNELWGLYFEEEYTAMDFKYVHQLQNLYFVLTATKLERGGV